MDIGNRIALGCSPEEGERAGEHECTFFPVFNY